MVPQLQERSYDFLPGLVQIGGLNEFNGLSETLTLYRCISLLLEH